MIATNPSKAEYTTWVKEQVKSEIADAGGSIASGIAEFLDSRFESWVDGAIGAVTEVNDYKLFSIFKTDDDFVVIGIFNSFINLSGAVEDLRGVLDENPNGPNF